LERLKKKKRICSVLGFRVFWEFDSENLAAAAAASFVRGGEKESFVAVERFRCQRSLSLSLSLSLVLSV
jgi:hypothetical protein